MNKVMVPYNPRCGCSPSFGVLGAAGSSSISAQMIALRQRGASPQAALTAAMGLLYAKGERVVTPAIQKQLAAGLQPLTKGMGSLGIASTAMTAVSEAATGAKVGQTVIPVPVVGAIIGAVGGAVYAIIHKSPVGKASMTWNQYVQSGAWQQSGRAIDEHSWGEAFKGMMDEGNNAFPGCGADRHKDMDCFTSKLANAIVQGYLSKQVPISASTDQVFQAVVIPWLSGGAGGLVNWNNLSHEPGQPAGNTIQMQMVKQGVDRYLAGLPITRADMSSYTGMGYNTHVPPLAQALQSLLQPAVSAPVATAAAVPTVAPVASIPVAVLPQVSATPYVAPQTPQIVPPDQTNALIQQLLAQGASQSQALAAATASLQAQGVNTAAPQVQQQLQAAVTPSTAGFSGGGMLAIVAGVITLGFALARPTHKGKK